MTGWFKVLLNRSIASIVLAHGGILVTHNIDEFKRVSGLKIEDLVE
jgi:predicted nucleic acid-binding protein